MSFGEPSTPYFQRREDWQPRKTDPDSPWREFVVKCLKCGNVRLRIGVVYDDGEQRVYLICPQCNKQEAVAV